jgi:hypothetical protein
LVAFIRNADLDRRLLPRDGVEPEQFATLPGSEVIGQDLDRHLAFQARVFGEVDLPHRPSPEGTEDLIEGKQLSAG